MSGRLLVRSAGAAATKPGAAIDRGAYPDVRERASATIRRSVAVVIRGRWSCRSGIYDSGAYFDGHFVTSESGVATNVPSTSSPFT